MDRANATKRTFVEQFERIWGQALVAVSAAEDEAGKVAQRVAELAGWSQDEVKRQVHQLAERLTTQRRDLERQVEDGVKRALSRMKVPRRDDIAGLSARLDALERRLAARTNRGGRA